MAGFGGSVKLTGESEYKKALKDITSSLKLVSSELKLTNTEFESGDKTLKQTKSSYDNMGKTLQDQKAKVSALKEALAQAEKEYGSNNEKVKMFKTQLNNAENQLKQMESATDKSTSELKEMKGGFDDAGKGALKFGDILKANVLGDVIVGGLKKLGSAVLSVGKAFVNIGKQAIESYADYEQLVGGVETLFKESAGIVQEYANNAYKTAGLSANQYMETVTSFSASLLQSLNGDTAKSAEIADMAITDMADNANKMGTDMSMLQSAYQGFAKQNYTMLDNLKLGYGGTKTEMERLLADASKISGIKYDISNLSDVYSAIHVIQTELGITGTTALEASTTISGSANAMKSAWQNLLTGIADDNADFGQLINNLLESLVGGEDGGGFLNNIFPRIEIALNGVIDFIIASVETLLPKLIEMGSNLITNLIQGVSENLPNLMSAIVTGLQTLLQNILQMLPEFLKMGITMIGELIKGIAQSLPELIPAMVDAVVLMVESLIDSIDLIIDAGIQLIMGLAEGLIEALPRLIEKIPVIIEKLIMAITNNLPKLVLAGIELVIQLAVGIVKAIPSLLGAIPKIISAIIKGFANYFVKMKDIGLNIVKGIWEGITGAFTWIKDKITGWVGNVLNFIKRLFGIHSPSTVFRDEIGTNLALGVGEGFTKSMEDVNKEMASAINTDYDLNINSNLSGAGATSSSSNYSNMVNAFKQALREVKVVLDDREMGTFVTNTMERVIYT